jgi:hypothetical protein
MIRTNARERIPLRADVLIFMVWVLIFLIGYLFIDPVL